MNYKKIYEHLMDKAKQRNLENVYFENHHIKPKCIGGNDFTENLVKLTAKEHYMAHHLLIKIYKNTEFYGKLICAFRFMSVDSHNGNRIHLKDYEYIRRLYSENHPMKDKNISKKVGIGVKKFHKKLSKEEKKEFGQKISKGLRKYFDELSEEDKIKISQKMKNLQNDIIKNKRKNSIIRYYLNENKEQKKERLKKQKEVHTEESYQKVSNSLKKFINELSDKDKNKRLENSLRKCNHIERGKSISKSKKGQKTNQQKIMGEKYAKMTDLEFENFLQNKNPKMYKRMKNLREKYLKGK